MVRDRLVWHGFASVALCLVALAGCRLETPLPEARSEAVHALDEERIRQAVERATAALNAGDVNAIVALHTEDAVVLGPDRPPEVGLQTMRSSFEGLFARLGVNESRTINELRVSGDWAFVWGTYRVTLTPKHAGDPVSEKGAYLDVLQRQADGSWKFARSIWNQRESK